MAWRQELGSAVYALHDAVSLEILDGNGQSMTGVHRRDGQVELMPATVRTPSRWDQDFHWLVNSTQRLFLAGKVCGYAPGPDSTDAILAEEFLLRIPNSLPHEPFVLRARFAIEETLNNIVDGVGHDSSVSTLLVRHDEVLVRDSGNHDDTRRGVDWPHLKTVAPELWQTLLRSSEGIVSTDAGLFIYKPVTHPALDSPVRDTASSLHAPVIVLHVPTEVLTASHLFAQPVWMALVIGAHLLILFAIFFDLA